MLERREVGRHGVADRCRHHRRRARDLVGSTPRTCEKKTAREATGPVPQFRRRGRLVMKGRRLSARRARVRSSGLQTARRHRREHTRKL